MVLVYGIYALVALAVYFFTPKILQRFTRQPIKHKTILFIASILFFLSLFLPSPLIQGDDTEFMTHFVGGGIFTGLLWLFIKKNMGWEYSAVAELVIIYLLVSGLGVANEVFELAVDTLGLTDIPPSDTWWDLLANNLGAFAFWTIYRLSKIFPGK